MPAAFIIAFLINGSSCVSAMTLRQSAICSWMLILTGQTLLQLPFNVAFNSIEATVMAANRGVGIMQRMDLVVAELLAAGKLQVVLPEWSAPGKTISVVWRRALRDSPKIRVFADLCADLLRQYRQRVDALLESPR